MLTVWLATRRWAQRPLHPRDFFIAHLGPSWPWATATAPSPHARGAAAYRAGEGRGGACPYAFGQGESGCGEQRARQCDGVTDLLWDDVKCFFGPDSMGPLPDVRVPNT